MDETDETGADETGADTTLRFVAGEAEAGLRLDRVLAARCPDLSRARIQALVAAGQATIGERVVADANHRVKPGAEIALHLPPPQAPTPLPEAIPLNVVFEDDQLLVLDKPAGLVVHPAAGHGTGTLVNALIAHCGDSLSGIGGVKRPGIVHRLDKDTTGLMVVAKTDRAHRHLAAQFADHGRTGALEREYLAVIWGDPGRARFTVDAPLDRHPVNREKIAVRRDGREAITHVELLERFPGTDGLVQASLVACRLETGRTHQIRVHMAHLGHPLLGDETYATGFRTKIAKLNPKARDALERLGRQALHAHLLGFEHPVTHEVLRFTSDMPGDMAALVDALRAA
jgi:23S rRNA pseudouridine1911/1915/1917 synthase